MIVANLATFPPRFSNLEKVVKSISPQVDRLNLVLNEYSEVLPGLEAYPNVKMILPPRDLKDVGKFFPDVTGADYVFLIDDDIEYPADYIERTVAAFNALPPGPKVAGYYASIYAMPKFGLSPRQLKVWLLSKSRRRIARCRRVFKLVDKLEHSALVDQVATGAMIIRAADMPPFSYMEGSEKFVDVRLSKWCFEQGISAIVLPREAEWMHDVPFDESIWKGFTKKDPPHVAKEIWSYAFKTPRMGERPV